MASSPDTSVSLLIHEVLKQPFDEWRSQVFYLFIYFDCIAPISRAILYRAMGTVKLVCCDILHYLGFAGQVEEGVRLLIFLMLKCGS
eukprot:GFUD01029546.1.p1 GENE.GFUD01029546.1~~GFUD01029546.1.p1  ORF type:complete len:100 (-),score=5.44 GFUD01029546.1:471-731(-)